MERRLRLRASADIKRVRGRGLAVAEGPLLAKVLPNALQPPQNRYQVVAGKKQGNAVQRNRVKRLVREALRHLDPTLAPGVDVLILVRGKAEEVPDYAAARTLLDRIVAKAGLAGARRGGEEARRRGGGAETRDESRETRDGNGAAAADGPSVGGGSAVGAGDRSTPKPSAAPAGHAAPGASDVPAAPEDAR